MIDLICHRANDPRITAVPAGTLFGKHCEKCKEAIVLSPSAQRAMVLDEEVHLICVPCYLRNPERSYDQVTLAPGYLEDRAGPQIPNHWRRRN